MLRVRGLLLVGVMALGSAMEGAGQVAPEVSGEVVPASAGGTIRGVVRAGAVPLPGVAITATNTLTGKKYATTTDLNGVYAMAIPRTGRYVVRAELAAFASVTSEARITAEAPAGRAEFGLELLSRVAVAQAGGTAGLAAALAKGVQALSVTGGDASATDASVSGGGEAGASMPSLGALGGAGGAADSVTVSGQVGQTNGLAGMSEDQVRQRIEDAVAQARQQGGASGDQANAVMGMLGGLLGGGGGGGLGGFGGGGRGGRGGGGFGGGAGGGFGRFDPTQVHGAAFYQGGFSALDAQQFSLTGVPTPKQSSNQNRYGLTFAGSPSIPGVVKGSSKQFVFLNVTGARSTNPLNLYGTVPTELERAGDFSETRQRRNGVGAPVQIYDPATGAPFAGNVIPQGALSAQALNLLRYYPLANVPASVTQGYNYQTVTTQGSNTLTAAGRYVRNFGPGGLAALMGGGGGAKGLRQSVNAGFSFSHAAQDLQNLIPVLGGKSSTDGYGVSAGYTVGYGRVTNNASVNWNRAHVSTINFFTGTAVNPAIAAGVPVPSQSAELARNGFYNGVPRIQLTNYTSLNDQIPRDAINQTISFSDFVSYGRKKHNMRFGVDVRRVHADQIGGNDPLGTFVFSGLVTESPADRVATLSNASRGTREATTGSSLGDFLLGQPQQTKVQAGLRKTYLRENVFDVYAQDDYRVMAGVTLNYGLRYEYFSPFVEKNNRLVNLDHNADFTAVQAVLPEGSGAFGGRFPRSLVNPDRTMFSPRLGVAWRPRFVKETVVRAGYGTNFNTGQFGTFAQSLASQPPFATTENNVLSSASNETGCVIAAPGVRTNLTLADGFSCATKAVRNTYAVNKNYRLGYVQVYNLDVQRTLPHGVVVNVGYNGSRGADLDIVRAPNATATTVTTANAQAFTYEDSVAESRLNQVVVSARKRLEKGVSVQAVYQYGHSIDNASSIGGSSVSQVQDDRRLDLEEGNSSFDVRHRLTGSYTFELPFGPNRAFLSQGGVRSKLLDGFAVSGDFTFASGSYLTPEYVGTAAQLAAGGTYTLRPDRVFSQAIAGAGTRVSWFNRAAFAPPANGFGTASRNSIAGPGTVSVNMTLGRTVGLGGTRSFEARMTAANVFNTVQYSAVDTVVNSATFGLVTGTAAQRRVTILGRYRF